MVEVHENGHTQDFLDKIAEEQKSEAYDKVMALFPDQPYLPWSGISIHKGDLQIELSRVLVKVDAEHPHPSKAVEIKIHESAPESIDQPITSRFLVGDNGELAFDDPLNLIPEVKRWDDISKQNSEPRSLRQMRTHAVASYLYSLVHPQERDAAIERRILSDEVTANPEALNMLQNPPLLCSLFELAIRSHMEFDELKVTINKWKARYNQPENQDVSLDIAKLASAGVFDMYGKETPQVSKTAMADKIVRFSFIVLPESKEVYNQIEERLAPEE